MSYLRLMLGQAGRSMLFCLLYVAPGWVLAELTGSVLLFVGWLVASFWVMMLHEIGRRKL